MQDIANAYGCKPDNIYNFFPKKEAILYEILRSQMEGITSSIQHLEDDDSTSPTEKLRLLITQHATYTLRYTKSSTLLFDVGLDSLSPAKRRKIVEFRNTHDRILCKIIRRGHKSQ
jgi:AcrR family transcriptional regulator